MTTFDEREKAYEAKFAHDQELKFRSIARRNKLAGQWAAAKLGLSGAETDEYVKSVIKADFEKPGDDDIVAKLAGDFSAKGIAVPDSEIRAKLIELLGEAIRQIEAEKK